MTRKSLYNWATEQARALYMSLAAFAAEHAYLWQTCHAPPLARYGKSGVAAAKRRALKRRNQRRNQRRGRHAN